MAEKGVIKHDIVITHTDVHAIPGMLDRMAAEGKEVINVQCIEPSPPGSSMAKFMIFVRWIEA